MSSAAEETFLRGSTDQRVLERAATKLASSPSKADHELLMTFLTDIHFLQRLDAVRDPAFKTTRFRRVVLALGENPATDHELARLAAMPEVHDDTDRMLVLLDAAARCRPLSAIRAEIFRRADPKMFTITNIALLTSNGSPNALDEVKREILNRPGDVEEASIVGMMHRAFLKSRTSAPVVRMARELVGALTSAVLVTGIFESFFDYQYEPWFGPVKSPPEPPPWTEASAETIVELLLLGDLAASWPLAAELQSAIRSTVAELQALPRAKTKP
jgi:hypothetical protein